MPTTVAPRSRRCRRTVPRVDACGVRRRLRRPHSLCGRRDGTPGTSSSRASRGSRGDAIAGSICRARTARTPSPATFFRLYERLGTIREPAKLPGWVATTARNEVHTLLRARRRTSPTDLDDEHLPAVDAEPAGRPPRAASCTRAAAGPGPRSRAVLPRAAAPAHHRPAAVLRRGRRAPRPAPREHRPHPPALPRPAPARPPSSAPSSRRPADDPDDHLDLARRRPAAGHARPVARPARPGARRRPRRRPGPPFELGPRRRGAGRARLRLADADAARSPCATTRLVEARGLGFVAGGYRLDVELLDDGGVVLGQLDPPAPAQVDARDHRTAPAHAAADDLGRFRFDGRRGPLRLRVTTATGEVVLTPVDHLVTTAR